MPLYVTGCATAGRKQATQQTMNVTAEHAGGAVVLELDERCRSVAALRRIISAALPDVREDGFDVTVQGRAVEDVDVCGLEEGATIQVVVSRRVVALDALRAAGRDVNKDGLEDGMFEAVQSGDVALCEQYLDAGGSPDTLRGSPFQPSSLLHAAVGHADLAMCELLLSRGCAVNVEALHLAISEPTVCKLLLQHGADVNKRNRHGRTLLHLVPAFHESRRIRGLLAMNPALRSRAKRHHEVREVLLQHGADMRARDCDGESPLGEARRRRQEVAKPHRFSVFNLFVKYGAPPLTPRELGRLSNPGRRKYSRYIQKLAKVQFKERKQQITWKGMGIVNAFVTDVLERLGGEAGRVTSFSGAKTLSVRSVVAAVKLQLPEELATHALAAGTAAVGRYAKACGGR